MHPIRLFQSTTFRLAAVYVLLFAASVAALGAITYLATSVALERRLDVRIEREMTSLRASFQSGGIDQLVAEVRKHEQSHPNGLLDYLVVGPHGEPLAGHLSRIRARSGWASLDYSESDGDVTRLRVLVAPLPSGVRVVIAA